MKERRKKDKMSEERFELETKVMKIISHLETIRWYICRDRVVYASKRLERLIEKIKKDLLDKQNEGGKDHD